MRPEKRFCSAKIWPTQVEPTKHAPLDRPLPPWSRVGQTKRCTSSSGQNLSKITSFPDTKDRVNSFVILFCCCVETIALSTLSLLKPPLPVGQSIPGPRRGTRFEGHCSQSGRKFAMGFAISCIFYLNKKMHKIAKPVHFLFFLRQTCVLSIIQVSFVGHLIHIKH